MTPLPCTYCGRLTWLLVAGRQPAHPCCERWWDGKRCEPCDISRTTKGNKPRKRKATA